MTDTEVLALALTAEAQGIDSERLLFGKLHAECRSDFPNLISRVQFNHRRRLLAPLLEHLRQHLAATLTAGESRFLVDSMPLEICRPARMNRTKICRQHPLVAPDKGFCAAQNQYFYGYKLHALCSARGIVFDFDLSRASMHDIHYLPLVKSQLADCELIGDKGYLSASQQLDLFTTANIRLTTPLRANMTGPDPFTPAHRRVRKRIETLFSQLCDQFMIRRNYAKSFVGFRARIMAKVAALTCLQWLNHQHPTRSLNALKYALA